MSHPRPTRRARRGAVALALVALAAVLLIAPTAAPASAPPRCGTFSLLGELTHPTAGAGSRFVTLVLTNVTRRSCTLRGYPGLRLLGPTNLPLPTRVVHVRVAGGPRRVVLAPGASARSDLRFSAFAHAGEPATGACEPNPARVRVAPPGGAHPFVIPWRLGPVCGHGEIDVKPLRA
ncbi:MAG: DUF4232 domain-containing protein [Actinobacteria bacterium]|nr:DUF4232 domain-containing protein [Actinomycetota bacterium]